jgi:hypothetical protein
MAAHLHRLNKKQERRRIAAGCVGKSIDMSILTLEEAAEASKRQLGEKEAREVTELVETEDTTDMENMFFHYVSVLRACFTGGLLD